MLIRSPSPAALLACLACLAACAGQRYDVKMTPARDGTTRSLEVGWPKGAMEATEPRLDEAELQRLGAIFGDPKERTQTTARFESRFGVALPADVGGSGRLWRIDTSLGSACFYLERFRGSMHAAAAVSAMLDAIDAQVDLALISLRDRVKDPADLARATRFMERLRPDLKDGAMIVFAAGVRSDQDFDPARSAGETAAEPIHRACREIAQFALERGYLEPEDIAKLGVPWFTLDSQWRWDSSADSTRAIEDILRRHVGQATVEAFRPSEDSMHEAAQTPEGKAIVQRWIARHSPDTPAEKAEEALREALVAAIPFRLSADQLSVAIKCPAAPLATNGTWKDEEKAVVWRSSMPTRSEKGYAPPTILYAVWSEPDPIGQARRGVRELSGRALLGYCLWHASLSPEHAATWDRFVAQASPDAPLGDLVEKFQFGNEGNPKAPDELIAALRASK